MEILNIIENTFRGSTSKMDEKKEKNKDETHFVALSLPNWMPYAHKKKIDTAKHAATKIHATILNHHGRVNLFFLEHSPYRFQQSQMHNQLSYIKF